MKKLLLLLVFLCGYSAIVSAQNSYLKVVVNFRDSMNLYWNQAIPCVIKNTDSSSNPNGLVSVTHLDWPGTAYDSMSIDSGYTPQDISIHYYVCGSWFTLDTVLTGSYYSEYTITPPCSQPCNPNYSGYFLTNPQKLRVTPGQTSSNYLHTWDFGDGTVVSGVSAADVTHTYRSTGNFVITHTVYHNSGYCSESRSDTVNVASLPCKPDFTYGGDGLVAAFFPEHPGLSRKHDWTFGDGSGTVTQENPSHAYASTGTYTVTHRIYDTVSGCDTSISKQILVSNTCQAHIRVLKNDPWSNGLQLEDSSVYNSSFPIKYYWRSEYSPGSYYQYYPWFSSAGQKTVSLKIRNGTCVDSTAVTLGIGTDCNTPVISLQQASPTPYNPNYYVRVEGLSQRPFTEYRWKFPDGSTRTGNGTLYAHNSSDSFDIWLYWDNGLNCMDSLKQRVSMPFDSSLNITSFSATNDGNSGYTTFQRAIQGHYTSVTLDYGDGTQTNYFAGSHWYPATGTYTAKLVVSNGFVSDSMTFPVSITNANQCFGGNISINTVWNKPNHRYFQSSVNLNYDLFPNGYSDLDFNWVFSDSSKHYDNYFSDSFATGHYTVWLQVSDPLGKCNLNDSDNFTVGNPISCNALFGSYAPNSANPRAIKFTPAHTASSYSWDFGDGSTSTQQSPTHTYANYDSYTVTLTVTGTGCSDTKTQTINVYGYCNAYFSYSFVAPYTIRFIRNTSSGTHYNRSVWYFGDGDSAFTGDTVIHTYNGAGGYYPTCYGADSNGNKNSGCNYTQWLGISTCGWYTGNNMLYGLLKFDDTVRYDFDSVKLYLIGHDSVAGTLTALDSFMVSDSATYNIDLSCHTGPFLLKAACYAGTKYYADFFPTYSADATLWSNANRITDTSGFHQMNINMVRGNNPGGPGFIGGYISQGANKSGAALEGIQVNLYTENGDPVAYTYSLAAGRYEFSNLAYGKYQVLVEIPGKPSGIQWVILSADEPTADGRDFEVNKESVSTLNAYRPAALIPVKVYPNPGSGEVFVECEYALEFEGIYDMTGKRLTAETETRSNGYRLDLRSLPAGNYLILLNSEQGPLRIRYTKQ